MTEKETPPEEQLFILMKRLRRLGLDAATTGEATFSPAQMALLDAIASRPGCGVVDAAEELGLTSPTVSVGVRRLEESGLVERKPDPQDGRSIQLSLTRRGQALQRQVQATHLRKFRRLLAGLQPAERQALLDLLQRALEAAEAHES